MQAFDPQNPNTKPPKFGGATVVDVDIARFTEAKTQDLIQLSVSGKIGADGTPGQDLYGNAGYGGGVGADGNRGRQGNIGGDAERGQNAGTIDCEIELPNNPISTLGGLAFDAQIRLKAKMQLANGHIQQVDEMLQIVPEADIDLLARGGDGGRGGRGGRGQDGGNGSRGRDATKYSSGGDGGDGGDGGRGGTGGRGGNGANGGQIVCKVSAEQAHLLLLFEPEIGKGIGGIGGFGGAGGNGGAGGTGGSSYSWTEKRGDQTISRYNAGGSRGRSGSSGQVGSSGTNGNDGIDGNLTFITTDQNSNSHSQTTHRYAVQITAYELLDAFEDNIYEFGEYIYVRNLQIENIGALPLPPQRHVYVLLKHSEWIESEPLALKVPKELAVGASFTFTEELAFQIKRPNDPLQYQRPFEVSDTLQPIALMGGILKKFRNAKRDSILQLRHPAVVSQIKGHHSIARGEASRLSWIIENLSTKELGQHGGLGRLLQSLFVSYSTNIEDEILPEHVLFFDAEGKLLDTEKGIFNAIPSLLFGEGKQLEISCFVGIHPNAEQMQVRMSRAELQLAPPDFPKKPETIQAPRFQIRVAKTYEKTPDSDILLVINKDTASKTVQEILAYYQQIGSKVDVWDISHYGRLDLENKSANGKTLLQDFEGKTILILNNPYQSNQSFEIYSSDLMEKREFLRAANEFGITVYIMGKTQNEGQNIAEQLGLPTNSPELSTNYENVKAFLEAQKAHDSDAIDFEGGVIEMPLGNEALPIDNFSNRSASMPIFKSRWFWQTPDLIHTKMASQDVVDRLMQQSPRATYYGIFDHNPKLVKKTWFGLRKQYQIGTLEIRQGPHRIHGGRLLTIEASEYSLKTGDFFRQNNAATHLMLRLSIWDSMEVMGDFLDANPEILNDENSRNSLLNAFMHHIAVEQSAFRQLSHRVLEKEEMAKQLVFLQSLTDFSLKFNAGRSAQALFFQSLFGHTMALLDAQHPWWNFVAPNYHNLRLTRILRKKIYKWIHLNFDTSAELRRKNKQLWEKNNADKILFTKGMEAIREKMFAQFKVQKNPARGEMALRYYQGEVKSGGGKRNRVGSKQLYESFAKKSVAMTENLLRFEQSEAKTIQDLTFSIQQDEKGFFINPAELKMRKVNNEPKLPDNLLEAPRTSLNLPLLEIEEMLE